LLARHTDFGRAAIAGPARINLPVTVATVVQVRRGRPWFNPGQAIQKLRGCERNRLLTSGE